MVRESVRQGYKTIALVRDKEKVTNKQGEALYGQFFDGADVVECDVTNPEQLTKVRAFYSIICVRSMRSSYLCSNLIMRNVMLLAYVQ